MLFPNYVFINHLDEIKLEFSKSKRNLERENNYISKLELDKKLMAASVLHEQSS